MKDEQKNSSNQRQEDQQQVGESGKTALNPNPRANENLQQENLSTSDAQAPGSEITDGEDA